MVHEPAAHRGKERRTDGEDHDPGPDVDQMALFRVLDHQTGPGGMRNAEEAVHQRRDDEKTQILGSRPDQAGHTPGQEVANKQGQAAPELIHERAAQQCREDLHDQPQAGDGSDLLVGQSQSQHVEGQERDEQVVGNTEHDLGQDGHTGIPF